MIKTWSKFNESIKMERDIIGHQYVESDLETEFGISIDDLKDVLQDLIDDDLKVELSLNIPEKRKFDSLGFWKHKMFIIKFESDSIFFDPYKVINRIDEIDSHLSEYGLKIFFISNWDGDPTPGVNLFVSDIKTSNKSLKSYPLDRLPSEPRNLKYSKMRVDRYSKDDFKH